MVEYLRIRYTLIIIVILSCLNGCGLISATRVDKTGLGGANSASSSPFTLNRLKPQIIRTPGTEGAPDTFTIVPIFEPDPSQRFVLNLNPGVFSSADWTMTFDESGTLTDTVAKTTDQTAATITSIAKLATTFLAGADQADPLKANLDKINTAVSEVVKGASPCLPDALLGKCKRISSNEADAAWSSWLAFLNRMKVAFKEAQTPNLTYSDDLERRLLLVAFSTLWKGPDVEPGSIEPFVKLGQYVENGTDNCDDATSEFYKYLASTAFPDHDLGFYKKACLSIKPIAYRVYVAAKSADRSKLKAIKTEVLKSRTKLRSASKNDENDELLAVNFYNLNLAKIAASSIFSPETIFLLNLLDVEPATWRVKQIATLNKKIAQRQTDLRVPPITVDENIPDHVQDNESADAILSGLLRRKAALLGVLADYDAMVMMRMQLKGNQRAEDRKAAIDIIGLLETRIAAAESALSPSKAAIKPDDPVVATFLIPDENFSESKNNNTMSEWIIKNLGLHGSLGSNERPAYVLVYEPEWVSPSAPPTHATQPRPLPQPILNNQPTPAVPPEVNHKGN